MNLLVVQIFEHEMLPFQILRVLESSLLPSFKKNLHCVVYMLYVYTIKQIIIV